MRKLISYFILGFLCVASTNLKVSGQICVPDGQYTSPGIYPDTSVGFAPAIQCVYYEQLLTMVVPTDTLGCTIDSIVLTGLTGLPPGLTYGCSPVSCGFPGGTSGCGLVYGTPTDTGTYALTANTTAYLSGSAFCTGLSPLAQPFSGYEVAVSSPITFNSTSPMCANACDGSITALHSDLKAPITYQWSDPSTQTTNPATGLCAGTYTVTITDSVGCVSARSFMLSDPPAVVANITGSTDITCNGDMDGTVTASGSGGTGSFTFMWSSGDTLAMASGLDTGTYMVTVTDANGCMDSNMVTITEPAVLALVTGSVDATCGNQDGSASVSVSGGTMFYTYLWNDSLMQTSDTAVGLGSGSYMVIVTDSNGCQDSANAGVSDLGAPTISLVSSTGVTCFGGCDASASISATGGATPYTFTWNTSPVQTGTTATELCGGTTAATVTDGLGCIAILSVTMSEPAALLISNETSSGPSCAGQNDGTIDITAAGGTGTINYSIDGGSNFDTSSSFTGLAGGSYTLVVMDDSGCTETGSVISLITPALLTVNTSSVKETSSGAGDGSAVASPAGGTPAYTYSWSTSPTQTTQTATGLTASGYQVVIIDANGCSISDSVMVKLEVGINEMYAEIEVKFYPNPANDQITIEVNYNEIIFLEIFDVVGKQVLRTEISSKSVLDVSSYREGMYLYRLSTINGMNVYQGKMCISK